MQLMRDAWFLVKAEYGGLRYKYFISLIMIGYFSFFGTAITGDLFTETSKNGSEYVFQDFFFLSIIPVLGFIYTRKSMNYIREDSYTTSLARMRCMPISFNAIMTGRILQLIVAMLINGCIFFVVQYLMIDGLKFQLSLSMFASFSLTWMGYGLIISGLYIYVELSASGKQYLLFTCIFMAVTIAFSIGCKMLNWSVMRSSLEMTNTMPILTPLVVWVVGAISLYASFIAVRHRLAYRDLM
ncbi:hypothetical protein [Paenibacillus selenitireducens]|uniref:hypothetical protein n=1 Tax=Paenibacillus selenitireducens TaxID=1324314 RepID=UPI00117C62E2|nr:hypothetical protein [Paenibacillus selenitireducens]